MFFFYFEKVQNDKIQKKAIVLQQVIIIIITIRKSLCFKLVFEMSVQEGHSLYIPFLSSRKRKVEKYK